MISDDERREIAARLRELHLGGGSKDLIEHTLSDAIGAWRESGMSWDFITDRLADLIEPPTQCPYYRSDRHYCSIHDVPTIDRDALLALADTLGSVSGELCDGCMLKDGCAGATCALGVAHEAARRIREALGVVE